MIKVSCVLFFLFSLEALSKSTDDKKVFVINTKDSKSINIKIMDIENVTIKQGLFFLKPASMVDVDLGPKDKGQKDKVYYKLRPIVIKGQYRKPRAVFE